MFLSHMKTYLLPSLKLTAALIIICAVIYPIIVAGIGKLSPGGGNGRTISHHGRVIGYETIGQKFTADNYFQGRPSAVDYNAAGSAGSNKGPSNTEYLQVITARIDTFLAHNPSVKRAQIPAELVTASGSGLDPHISVKAAHLQAQRVAKARHTDEAKLHLLIDRLSEKGLFAPDRINVLKLNIALDTNQ